MAGINNDRATIVLAQNFMFAPSTNAGKGVLSFETWVKNEATISGSDSSEAVGNLRQIMHSTFITPRDESTGSRDSGRSLVERVLRIERRDDGSDEYRSLKEADCGALRPRALNISLIVSF